eukprot:jgi/Tetstr1/423439/TSEL_014120.t1
MLPGDALEELAEAARESLVLRVHGQTALADRGRLRGFLRALRGSAVACLNLGEIDLDVDTLVTELAGGGVAFVYVSEHLITGEHKLQIRRAVRQNRLRMFGEAERMTRGAVSELEEVARHGVRDMWWNPGVLLAQHRAREQETRAEEERRWARGRRLFLLTPTRRSRERRGITEALRRLNEARAETASARRG